MSARRLLPALLLLMAPLLPASAQELGPFLPGTFELGLSVRNHWFGDSYELENRAGPVARAGVFLLPNVEVEGSAAFIPTASTRGDGNRARLWSFSGRLLYNWPVGDHTAFLIGAGGTYNTYSKGVEGNEFGGGALVGMRLGLGDIMSVRIDGTWDYMPSPNDKRTAEDKDYHYGFQAGLTWMFGPRRGETALRDAEEPDTLGLQPMQRADTVAADTLAVEADTAAALRADTAAMQPDTAAAMQPDTAAAFQPDTAAFAPDTAAAGPDTAAFAPAPVAEPDTAAALADTLEAEADMLVAEADTAAAAAADTLAAEADTLVAEADTAAAAAVDTLEAEADTLAMAEADTLAVADTAAADTAAAAPEMAEQPALAEARTWSDSVRVFFEEPGVTLVLQAAHFPIDHWELDADEQTRLEAMAAELVERPDIRITVIGHTDTTGPRDWNEELSRYRANSVRDFLVRQGVAADRITTEGRAWDDPITTNDTVEGRALNRRTEVRRPE